MPYVNIKITREGTTREQKAEIIKRVSEVLLDVLKKPLDSTYVVIDEVAFEDWGVGGMQADDWRKLNADKWPK